MAPVYDKDGSSTYRREGWYVEDGGLAYPVQRAYVKVGGSLYQYFGGGTLYAATVAGTGQIQLYTVDVATGVVATAGGPQSALAQTNSGVGLEGLGGVLYAATLPAPDRMQLYSVDVATGALASIGAEQILDAVCL